jgi:hypothetical protein
MRNFGIETTMQNKRLLPRILVTTLTLLFLVAAAPVIAQQDESVSVDVTAADRLAATYNMSNFRYHVLPANTKAGNVALAARSFGTPFTAHATNVVSPTIPSVPAPGFYPEDLVYFGGKVLATTTPHAVFVNTSSCGTVATCWGTPVKFLSDLSNSTFVHLVDQYVGSTASNRYAPGSSASASISLFGSNVVGQNEIFAVVHAAAKTLGTGYGHMYHVFLPKGVDTCFDLSSVCYSPDNPSTFFFCAYHGSLTFSDIGHVLFSVEPYQNVSGCQAAPPDPNGILADSTNSVLSHEQFESITDPDINSWISDSSLLAAGAEIGDLCEPLGNSSGQFLDPVVHLNGLSYEIQLEYSNHYHACAGAP